jgi:hypothetical protein
MLEKVRFCNTAAASINSTTQLPGLRTKMPPLSVSVDENLASFVLPGITMVRIWSAVCQLTLFSHTDDCILPWDFRSFHSWIFLNLKMHQLCCSWFTDQFMFLIIRIKLLEATIWRRSQEDGRSLPTGFSLGRLWDFIIGRWMEHMEKYCLILHTKWRHQFTKDPCFLYLKAKGEVTETVQLPCN